MNLRKIRILGSGFTNDEYELYRFGQLTNPEDTARFYVPSPKPRNFSTYC
jgi:hypothetical protein